MTLLITVFAAIISSLVWYLNERARKLNISVLCWIFWGASLMWLVDAVVEYIKEGASYFTPSGADMLNDAFLGLTVVAVAMIIWLCVICIKDSEGVISGILKRNEKKS